MSLAVFSVSLLILSVRKPFYFILLSISILLSLQMFLMYPSEYIEGVSSMLTSGDLSLSFLRFTTPDNMFINNVPKLIFVAMLVNVFVTIFNKSWKLYKKELIAVGLFILTFILSIIINGSIIGAGLLFLYYHLFPLVAYFYIIGSSMLIREKELLFGYILFMCLELQLLITTIQNFPSLLVGEVSFGDYAFGTFSFPYVQTSTFLLALSIFYYVSKYFFLRKKKHLMKAGIAFFGVLLASVGFFTILLLLVLFAYFLFLIGTGAGGSRRLILKTVLIVASIISIPIIVVVMNPDLLYGFDYIALKIQEILDKPILEIPKVFSFLNLYNMMVNNGSFLFGSGPGMFLSLAAQKYSTPLWNDYNSTNVLVGFLGSGDWVENSFVILVGEVGIAGWFSYMLFYGSVFLNLQNRNINCKIKKQNVTLNFTMMVLFFCSIYSFTISLFEIKENIVVSLIIAALVNSYPIEDRLSFKEKNIK
ncbi:hypothetical protein L6Q79_00100 [bacterium]|nr:hypothetical protein [bacterium]